MTDAWRLTFSYEGNRFSLKSIRRLTKRVPPARSSDRGVKGRFVELRGKGKEVLYRRSITNLIPETLEYPTGDPAQPFGRVPAPKSGEVSILVPARPEGLVVSIVEAGAPQPQKGRRKAQSAAAAEAARDLIVVDLPHEADEK